jgi:Bacterial transcriptional activator domain/Bacterial extracellular solute-binding proteins, family 5 Middle
VSQLRRLLAGYGAEIITRGRSYELRLADGGVDAVEFESLLEQSRAREALALWHGEPLADVADEPFAATEIRRLGGLRLRAAEMAIDADLAAGRHGEVIGELDAVIDEHPLRERLDRVQQDALRSLLGNRDRCGRRGPSQSISASRMSTSCTSSRSPSWHRPEVGRVRRGDGRLRGPARTRSHAGTGVEVSGWSATRTSACGRRTRGPMAFRTPSSRDSTRDRPNSAHSTTVRLTLPCSITGLAAGARLRARYGGRLHTDLELRTWFAFLNTHAPPFDDARVRRALNYAVDRGRVAELFGTRETHVATRPLLQLGMRGYTPSCPFTANPDVTRS